ncbi:DUF2813 domain-containing protein [Mesorhizobium sp. B2-1-8]|uniref:DUF2813 domain-containing protein n=1 Tax=Mesorhizobium sp. B2-1-8 TaxID=2589967 RepID=UPI0039EFF68B
MAGNVVLLGENRVGKSNLLFAIQLILDLTLPDSARQLKLTDFWDGGPADHTAPIEVHLEISDFATDMALTASYRKLGNDRYRCHTIEHSKLSRDGEISLGFCCIGEAPPDFQAGYAGSIPVTRSTF